jgi:hypothetical protein
MYWIIRKYGLLEEKKNNLIQSFCHIT